MLTEVQLAYLAGFFDGEGCVMIARNRRTTVSNYRYSLCVLAYQLAEHREPLDLLHQNFGGTLYVHRGANKGTRKMATWTVRNQKAVQFLTTLVPYLLVKRRVVEHVLLFERWRDLTRADRKQLHKSTPEYLKVCELAKLHCSQLNTRRTHQGVAPA